MSGCARTSSSQGLDRGHSLSSGVSSGTKVSMGRVSRKSWRLSGGQRAREREMRGAAMADGICDTEPVTQHCPPDVLTYH